MYYAFTGYWIGTFSLFPSSSSSFLRLFFFLQFSPGCVTFCPLLLSENPLRKMPLIANAALGSFSIYSSSFEPFFFFFLTKSNFSFHCLNGSAAPSALHDYNTVFPTPNFVFCLMNPFCMAPPDRCVDKGALWTKTSLWPDITLALEKADNFLNVLWWTWNGYETVSI